MTYWNPVVQYGVQKFAEDLKEAGGQGLITPDLIPDEATEWLQVLRTAGLERVFLAAPSSSMSVWQTPRSSPAASSTRFRPWESPAPGTTWILLRRNWSPGCTNNGATATCVGLGISTAEHVADVVSFADGAIVGSAFVRALSDGGVDAVRTLAAGLSTGTRRSE
jgi:tryptophan synthase alpha chain